MMYRVPYSVARPGSFTQVPGAYVGQVLRNVRDLNEVKVTLLLFYLLSKARDYPAHITRDELVTRAGAVLGLSEEDCLNGVHSAVTRGVFLQVPLPQGDTEVFAYCANVEEDLEAIERWRAAARLGARSPAVPNIFELYEQNIGIITPLIAEELKDAQKTYPAEWVEEAFREAVRNHKQNWRYVSRILERWSTEGKASGTNRQGAGADDPDKYVKGRFGRVVRR